MREKAFCKARININVHRGKGWAPTGRNINQCYAAMNKPEKQI